MKAAKEIVLITINAKWIHPSLALRLLKANLGPLEDNCRIIEFNLRQPLNEMKNALLAESPRILGISVSVWNHIAALELLRELENAWIARPVIVLGGPEVSHLRPEGEIFRYADHVIRGEGENAFRLLCENIMGGGRTLNFPDAYHYADLPEIKTAYHLYTDEDVRKKLIYAESGRGCPYNCEFCLSSFDSNVREFPLEKFLEEMDILIQRGVKTFKFLDRSFNINVKRSLRIMEFFLERINGRPSSSAPFVVHFEMVPSLFPDELRVMLARFPPGSLRLEIGIQTLNPEVSARIGRVSNPEKEIETLRFLYGNTSAVIHADLIAGLPGEDLDSFGRGFDMLWSAFEDQCQITKQGVHISDRVEIQTGILKLLPGTPILRRSEYYRMRCGGLPPYEVTETSAMSGEDLSRVKNFSRFWELIVNRKLVSGAKLAELGGKNGVFKAFIGISDRLFSRFGRSWGIDKKELILELREI